MDYGSPGSSVHGDSPGKNTGVSCHALSQGIFPTQGSKAQVSCIAGRFFTSWATGKLFQEKWVGIITEKKSQRDSVCGLVTYI